jgi:hypothetical protein
MKNQILLTLCIFTLALIPAVRAQTPQPSTLVPDPVIPGVNWSVTPMDGMSSRWEGTIPASYPATNAASWQTSQYFEVSPGLNYIDGSGLWQRSQDLIELQPDGSAAAVHGPHKLYVPPSILDAATLVTASNRVFQTKILGLVYYDAASGSSAVLSPVRNTSGELLPPNQILFQSAFASVKADVLLKYTSSGFESDVIFLQRPPPPSAFGLSNETTRLQIWHEYWAPSQPAVSLAALYVETNAALRATMAEPDLTGQILNFGDIWFPLSAAFLWDGDTNLGQNIPAEIRLPSPAVRDSLLLSATQWQVTSNACYLIESLRWPDIAPKLSSLPAMVSAEPDLKLRLRLVAGLRPPVPESPGKRGRAMRLASRDYHAKGLVWPYITIASTGTDYECSNSVTYYISSSTYFSGNLTLDQNCIIKFNLNAYLLSYGSMTFNGSSSSPSILTSKDENIYGAPIAGGTGYPTYAAAQAIWDYYIGSNVSVNGVQVRWAQTAVELDSNPGTGLTNSLNDSSIQMSTTGIEAQNCTVNVNSSSKCSVGTDFYDPFSSVTFVGSLTDICTGSVGGIPDTWFIKYLGAIGTTTANPSGDGLNNLLDYTLGLNPSYNMLAQATNRANYAYTRAGWLTNAVGTKTGAAGSDHQGNLTTSGQ